MEYQLKTDIRRTIVTPIYEDAESSSLLLVGLAKSLGNDVFVVAVDDGSVSEPVDPAMISRAGLNGVVLRLKRNVGHQRAIAVGIGYVAQHMPRATCVVMDSDGEDMPLSVPDLLEPLGDDGVDVVVAQRRNRAEKPGFRAFYMFYKVLFRLMTGRTISFGNFMALRPAAVKRLAAMQELGIHVAGCVLVSQLRVRQCPIDRGRRYAGKSKMNFSALVLHGFHAFMVFAEYVLVRVSIACAVVAVLSLVGIAASLLLKMFGMATPGWASTALGILILVLSQTGLLTLTTLMLTGITRGNNLLSLNYLDLVDETLRADAETVAA